MSKGNIVYILGAGASYQAIPVYKDFNNSLSQFLRMMENTINEEALMEKLGLDKLIKDNRETIKNQIELYSLLVNESFAYGTPDTYAVALEKKPELRDLKVLLGGFLTYLQFGMPTDFSNLSHQPGRVQFGPVYYPQQETTTGPEPVGNFLDRRYISLWASLLSQTDFKVPDNVYFITWNYDFQVEKALGRFVSASAAKKFAQTNIIQLNGSCKTSAGLDIHEQFLTPNIVKQIIEHLFEDKKGKPLGIKFSWEKDDNLQKAKSILEKALCAVLIGYSVPDYNRKADIQIFDTASRHCNMLYIQDIQPESIRKKLATISHNYERFDTNQNQRTNVKRFAPLDGPAFELIDFTSQFVIPREFWSSTE